MVSLIREHFLSPSAVVALPREQHGGAVCFSVGRGPRTCSLHVT